MMNWIYMPPWGVRAVACVAAGLAVLLAFRAFRERRSVRLRRQWPSVALRLCVIAGLVFVALNPTGLIARAVGAKPKMILLVDASASMAVKDVGGESRLGAALRTLREKSAWSALNSEFTLDTRSFDKTSRPVDLAQMTPEAAVGDASDIAGALSNAVSDLKNVKSQAGVLLVSDGRATTEGAVEAARLALAHSIPLWTWRLGGETPRYDLWIETSAVEILAFANTEVELSAALHEVGYPNRSFRVEALKDGEVIERKDVVPDPAQGVAAVTVQAKAPASGEHRYVFRVAPDGKEADTQNNERSVFLRVVGEKVRVLLAEGQPHWDTKFLVQCMKRDPRVDLTAVYQLGPNRRFGVISAGGKQRREDADLFPRTAQEMRGYDVILFGRGCEPFFREDTEDLLADFVAKRGGAIVFTRGKAYGGRFAALAKLEPVVWGGGLEQDVLLRPTGAGRESPVFELGASGKLDDLLERLPHLDQVSLTTGKKPLAVVLAAGATSAGESSEERTILFAYQRYGQGKIVTLNAAGLWRWAFREKGRDEDEAVYGRFWLSLLRWLLAGSDFLPGSDVALRSARRYYTDEQPMQFLVSTREISQETYRPRLTVSGPGRKVEMEPREQAGGEYTAEAGPFPPGSYQVVLHNNVGRPPELAMTVEVVSASVENRVLSADPEGMKRLAETSGGQELTATDVPNLPAVVKRWRAQRQISDEKASLWDRWWLLTGLLAAMGAEWYSRRREGLL